jgi:hypothetical protein
MAAPYSVLGKGSYGAVFSPPLNNQEDAGPVRHPSNAWVSKVFYRKNDMNKAVSEADRVSALMNDASSYRVHPHTTASSNGGRRKRTRRQKLRRQKRTRRVR